MNILLVGEITKQACERLKLRLLRTRVRLPPSPLFEVKMKIDIPRDYAQAFSLFFVSTGLAIALTANSFSAFGFALIGVSCWVLLMSESILLSKVNSEMFTALECLRKKQEFEIRELLAFLRSAKVGSSPYSSIEGAKTLLRTINYPAMVLTQTHQIINANKKMHELLGWDAESKELDGKPVYIINDPVVMSSIGAMAAQEDIQSKTSMITQYVYVHKSGKRIYGQLSVHKINTEGFFTVFHPASECLLSFEDILSLKS